MSRVAQRLEEWKRKIVDLSRRNRLLFFSRTRGSTLRITEPSLPEIFDRLVNSERAWEFFMPPDAQEIPTSDNGPVISQPLPYVAPTREDSDTPNESRLRLRRAHRHADEVVTDIEEGTQLRSILRNLHRRSRTDFEERGVRILFLTFGILEWKEIERRTAIGLPLSSRQHRDAKSEIINSPILLVPVELRRDSVNDPFQLCPVDEEIVINPALAVKLGEDFNVQLPPVPEDWDSVSLQKFLADFEAETKKYTWSVAQELWLGLFSFHKLVIYRDLKNHGQLLESHPVVRCICEEEKEPVSVSPPDAHELDTKTSPETSFLVADADSSQLVGIEAVKSGSNLVIQGPPGTGKSQTITNLIAEFIARGKSVLFVSEKMAALEVVFQRLHNANLGHFCLQLHSHRANKRDVIQELYKTYAEQLQPKKGLTEFEAKQLVERRNKLNDYVHSLHLVRRPLGHSAFEGLGWVAGLEEIPYVPGGAFDTSSMSPETLDAAEQLAYRLKPMWNVAVAGETFPWFGCTHNAFTLENKANLQTILNHCIESITGLREAVGILAQQLGLEAPTMAVGADWLLEACKLLKQCPGVEKHWVLGSNLDEIASETERYRGLSRTHQENRAVLVSLYTSDFLSLPSGLRDQLKASLEELSSHMRCSLEDDAGFVANRTRILEWPQDLGVRLENWVRDGEALQQSLGLQDSLNVRRLRQLVRIAQICQSEDRPDESWFQITKLREVTQALPSVRESFEKRTKERSSIFAEYEPAILELDTKNLIEKFSGPYSSFFRVFRPGYYKARNQVRRLRKSGKLPNSILADLRRVQGQKDFEVQLLASFPRYKELLGACFRGFETDFGRVNGAASNAQELVELAGIQPIPNQFSRQASAQGLATMDLRNVANRLKQSLEEWGKKLSGVKPYLPSDLWDGSALPLEERSLTDLKSVSSQLGNAVVRVCELTGCVLSCACSTEHFTCHRMIGDLDRLSELRRIESEIAAESEHLRERFGTRFDGVQTSWDQVLEAVQWALRFKRHMASRQVPDPLLNLVEVGKEKAPESGFLEIAVNRVKAEIQHLSRDFREGFPAVGGTPLLQLDFGAITEHLRRCWTRSRR